MMSASVGVSYTMTHCSPGETEGSTGDRPIPIHNCMIVDAGEESEILKALTPEASGRQ